MGRETLLNQILPKIVLIWIKCFSAALKLFKWISKSDTSIDDGFKVRNSFYKDHFQQKIKLSYKTFWLANRNVKISIA